jgi:hypothetical protein
LRPLTRLRPAGLSRKLDLCLLFVYGKWEKVWPKLVLTYLAWEY